MAKKEFLHLSLLKIKEEITKKLKQLNQEFQLFFWQGLNASYSKWIDHKKKKTYSVNEYVFRWVSDGLVNLRTIVSFRTPSLL